MISIHPALLHTAFSAALVCGKGTCVSPAQCLTLKGNTSRYSTWATLYQCRAEQAAGWKPLLPCCTYDPTLTLTVQEQWRPICQAAQASAWCVSVWHSEHMHLHLDEQSLLAGRRWDTPGARSCVCVYTLMSTSAYTHTQRVRDRAKKKIDYFQKSHPLHWYTFKAMRTISRKHESIISM